jgi:hypothetical protein
VYYPLAIFDSNHDSVRPEWASRRRMQHRLFLDTPGQRDHLGRNHETSVNFGLFDSSAILGTVTYSGSTRRLWNIYVGLFDGGPSTAPPVAGMCWPEQLAWGSTRSIRSIPDDQYYLGAFLDEPNGTYDPATDPASLYGGVNSPTAINVMTAPTFRHRHPDSRPATAARQSVDRAARGEQREVPAAARRRPSGGSKEVTRPRERALEKPRDARSPGFLHRPRLTPIRPLATSPTQSQFSHPQEDVP